MEPLTFDNIINLPYPAKAEIIKQLDLNSLINYCQIDKSCKDDFNEVFKERIQREYPELNNNNNNNILYNYHNYIKCKKDQILISNIKDKDIEINISKYLLRKDKVNLYRLINNNKKYQIFAFKHACRYNNDLEIISWLYNFVINDLDIKSKNDIKKFIFINNKENRNRNISIVEWSYLNL